MPVTLAIDFGSKYIGVALLKHTSKTPNRPLYAGTIVVDPQWLTETSTPRGKSRRIRRTRKTHKRRLRNLAQALHGIDGADHILRFCRRRGYSHEPEDTDDESRAFHVPREEFFLALEAEIGCVIPASDRSRVLSACRKHLNAERRREAELRPARFENRNPTKCQWEGCRHNVPRADNAVKERLQQALYAWLKPIFDESEETTRLRRSVDHWIDELAALAKLYSHAETLEEDDRKATKKEISRRKSKIFRNLKSRTNGEASEDTADSFAEAWSSTYSRNITDIVSGKQGGRIRYCREHSDKFVDYFLEGKVIPNKQDVSEVDLVSRKLQIVFSKLWRYIEGRLLPLAGGQIDRVVVERVAFDILSGPIKKRQELGEEEAAEMYWNGPQAGFSSRREMFKAEFDGRCAYCGRRRAARYEEEHLLPQSRFPFNSYFNLLPACSTCNAQKGSRTAAEAGLAVHPEAYEAYSDYLAGLRVPHLFHTIKKGLLKLLVREGGNVDAERKLGMLADNLVNISSTQRGPRPLARYLAGRLEKATGQRPETAYVAGRHTALYRSILLPEYEKPSNGDGTDLVNHAIDAIVLGCQLPSAPAIENRRWNIRPDRWLTWREKVRRASPPIHDGIPTVEPVTLVSYFEEDLGGGYCSVPMSAFNWNRDRKLTNLLDPVRITKDKEGSPRVFKRAKAADVLANLRNDKKRPKQIDAIARKELRQKLKADPSNAARQFVRWLQKTTKAGLADGLMGNHPADVARKRILTEFVEATLESILEGEVQIPHTIGVSCLNAQGARKFDTPRLDDRGEPLHHYATYPAFRELHVGYKERDGSVDRSRPIVFCVNQVYEVTIRKGRQRIPVDVPDDSPLHGRPLNSAESYKTFRERWQEAFGELCEREGIVTRFRISLGVVIEKTTGEVFQLRNFDDQKPWMQGGPFKDIRRVYRSPLRYLQEVE